MFVALPPPRYATHVQGRISISAFDLLVSGSRHNFGLRGLIPSLVTKRNFLTTTPTNSVAKAGVPGTGITIVNHI